MHAERQQNSTAHPVLIHLVSSTDHVTAVTGASVTVQLAKDGAASWSAASGTVTEIGNGLYWFNGHAADRNTLGACAIRASATGADSYKTGITVVPWDPFDAQRGTAGTALPAADAGQAGGVATVDGAEPIAITQLNALAQVYADNSFVPAHVVGYDLAADPGQLVLQASGNPVTYSPGTFGKLVTTNLDAAVSSRSTLTQAQVTGGAYALQTDASGYVKVSGGTGTGQVSLSGGKVAATVASGDDADAASVKADYMRRTDNVAGLSAQAKADVTAAVPSASDNATAVLDATASSHNTAGTIGAKINSSGAGGGTTENITVELNNVEGE